MERASNNLIRSFKNAIEGIIRALRIERNLKIHFVIGIAVAVVSLFLPIDERDLLWLYFAVFSVIGAEILNTLVEKFLDLFFKDYDPSVKLVKDIAAGFVLWYVLFSVVVGLLILGEALFSWRANVVKVFVSVVLVFFPISAVLLRRFRNDRQDKSDDRG